MNIFEFLKKKIQKSEPPKTPVCEISQPISLVQPTVVPITVPTPTTTKATSVSMNGIECIKHDEGFRKKPYLCTSNIPTIGFGTTYYEDGRKVTLQDEFITLERAMELLMHHVKTQIQEPLNKLIKTDLNQNQYDALTSFVYNVGIGNFGKSTMLKLINEGKMKEAAAEFHKWNKGNGKVVPGLVLRRQREADLFTRSV